MNLYLVNLEYKLDNLISEFHAFRVLVRMRAFPDDTTLQRQHAKDKHIEWLNDQMSDMLTRIRKLEMKEEGKEDVLQRKTSDQILKKERCKRQRRAV